MAGRKPKPSHIRLMEGNPGKRPVNKSEPKPASGKPYCPRELSDEAKKEWKRIVSELDDMGLASKADRAALALYCDAWAMWREACDQIAEQGLTTLSPNGHLMQSPYVSIRNNAFKQIKSMLTEFGLTPSSRSRVSVPAKEEEDPLQAFMRRKAG